MHEPVIESIEELVAGGRPSPAAEAHLRDCPSCRGEVAVMRNQSELFRALRSAPEGEPAAGFYARVMNRIETQAKPSLWSLLGESLFAKRIAYASMSFVVLLGSYALTSTRGENSLAVNAPEVIMAVEDSTPSSGRVSSREAILVTLATYEE